MWLGLGMRIKEFEFPEFCQWICNQLNLTVCPWIFGWYTYDVLTTSGKAEGHTYWRMERVRFFQTVYKCAVEAIPSSFTLRTQLLERY